MTRALKLAGPSGDSRELTGSEVGLKGAVEAEKERQTERIQSAA